MNSELLHILQHSLGVDQYGRGRQYRNHFVCGEGGKDWHLCQELVREALMQHHAPREIFGNDHCFTVTELGKKIMLRESPTPPKISRGKQRYLDFLNIDGGFSFGEYLKNGWYRKT